jgi:peptidoglycan hydrolase CwlO-like protein
MFTTATGGGMIDLLIKNKNMIKNFRIGLPRFYSVILSLSFFGTIITPGVVFADQYTQQIQNIQNLNSATQQNVNGLQAQAQTYQATVDQLQTKISAIQSTIQGTEAQISSVQIEISANQQKLIDEKNTLAAILQGMYVDGNMTTLESLATSNSISDFVTKVEYQNIVQQQMQGSLKTISDLQKKLDQQQASLAQDLATQQNQNAQLSSDQQQQASLLAYNQQQQASYTTQIQSNNTLIKQLQAEEAAAIAAISGSNGSSRTGSSIVYQNMSAAQNCGGGYSYCYYNGQLTYLDTWVPDPWGFNMARECVHYVLDYLQRNGYIIPTFPGGEGNANNWVSITTSAPASTRATLVSSSNLQPGDVVYMPIGSLGHVAIVDQVYGNGWAQVSQYNWYPGRYSTMDLQLTPNLSFLQFQKY